MNRTTPGSRPIMPWVRALFLMPAVLFGLFLVAGENGHTAVPFDALSGGVSYWQMVSMMMLGYFGMLLFAASLLIAYAAFVINGISFSSGELRKKIIFLFAAMMAGYAVIWYVDTEVRSEISAAELKVEKIESGRWSARSCGRGQYICLDVEGGLGRATVKAYFGSSGASLAELDKWVRAAKSNKSVSVEWGRTPVGWNATRSVTCGKIRLHNDWL